MTYQFIAQQQGATPGRWMCRALVVRANYATLRREMERSTNEVGGKGCLIAFQGEGLSRNDLWRCLETVGLMRLPYSSLCSSSEPTLREFG
jgi:hypothetical protein